MLNILMVTLTLLLPQAVVSWPSNMNVSTSSNISSLESPVPSSSYMHDKSVSVCVCGGGVCVGGGVRVRVCECSITLIVTMFQHLKC